MNKKLIIGIIAVIVVIIASVSIFKDSKSEDMKPKYSQKDMDKVIDKHFNEQQELKTQIKELKSKVTSYEKSKLVHLKKRHNRVKKHLNRKNNQNKKSLKVIRQLQLSILFNN
ncbi:hypothetical protein AAHB52_01315 [Bacillus toyonensis]